MKGRNVRVNGTNGPVHSGHNGVRRFHGGIQGAGLAVHDGGEGPHPLGKGAAPVSSPKSARAEVTMVEAIRCVAWLSVAGGALAANLHHEVVTRAILSIF